MTEGRQYPQQPPAVPPEKLSLWQRFKRWPLIARVGTIGCGGLILLFGSFLILGIVIQIVDPDGMEEIRGDQQQQREADAEQQTEEEAEAEAERLAEEQRQAEEEASAAEEAAQQVDVPEVVSMPGDEARDRLEDIGLEATFESDEGSVWSPANWVVDATDPNSGEDVDEGTEVVVNVVRPESEDDEEEEEDGQADEGDDEIDMPDGIEAQADAITQVRDFDEASTSVADGRVQIEVEIGPGWSESSMCRGAREQTIRGLQFFRDNVEADYDRVHFSYFTRSEPDATGDASILPMAGLTYDRDTVGVIDDSAVMIANVWEAADDGGKAIVCQRAES